MKNDKFADSPFDDAAEAARQAADEILARLPPTPGETTSPGIPLTQGHPFYCGAPVAEVTIATPASLIIADRATKLGHPNRPIDLAAFGDSIDAFQQWMFDQPLPTPKITEDARNEAVKRFGRLSNLTMGLAGEAGEAVELLKKHLRDDAPIDLPHLKLELGDIAIVVSLIAAEFGMNMSDVLEASVEKVKGRIARGTLRGAGDDR